MRDPFITVCQLLIFMVFGWCVAQLLIDEAVKTGVLSHAGHSYRLVKIEKQP
jgi:chemotaxis receptor (MCP) glutamine deamidase CheD